MAFERFKVAKRRGGPFPTSRRRPSAFTEARRATGGEEQRVAFSARPPVGPCRAKRTTRLGKQSQGQAQPRRNAAAFWSREPVHLAQVINLPGLSRYVNEKGKTLGYSLTILIQRTLISKPIDWERERRKAEITLIDRDEGPGLKSLIGVHGGPTVIWAMQH